MVEPQEATALTALAVPLASYVEEHCRATVAAKSPLGVTAALAMRASRATGGAHGPAAGAAVRGRDDTPTGRCFGPLALLWGNQSRRRGGLRARSEPPPLGDFSGMWTSDAAATVGTSTSNETSGRGGGGAALEPVTSMCEAVDAFREVHPSLGSCGGGVGQLRGEALAPQSAFAFGAAGAAK